MKLSEAILAGCSMYPEKTAVFFFEGERAACVLGAAFAGTFGRPEHVYKREMLNEAHPIMKRAVLHPERPGWVIPLQNVAVELNDLFGWSREEIAAWIALVEREVESMDKLVDDVARELVLSGRVVARP
jgi:hypothetical protein